MISVAYMCLDVRGAIRDLQKRRGKRSYMIDDTGRALSKDEAIDRLMDELAKGRAVIPMNRGCRNPCESANCTGFDYSGGGCPGYEIEEGKKQ